MVGQRSNRGTQSLKRTFPVAIPLARGAALLDVDARRRPAHTCACAPCGDRQARDALAISVARGDADDGELADAIDLAEGALDVVGIHVLSGRRDDDVLDATDDLELAVLVEPAEESPVRSQPPSVSVREVASSSV